MTSGAAWLNRLAKLRSVKKNRLSMREQQAEHDQSADRGQGAHLAAADALPPGLDLVAESALAAAADQVARGAGSGRAWVLVGALMRSLLRCRSWMSPAA